jgi:dipeptidyl aminopeptidase/acylaminoacyl peptidase
VRCQVSRIFFAGGFLLALFGSSHALAAKAIPGRVVYVGSDSNLYRLDFANGKSTRLLAGTGREIHNAVWSPDGTQVAFLAAPTILQPGRQDDIYVMAGVGTSARRVSQQGRPLHDLSWFPDGHRLLFGTGFNGGFQTHVLRLDDGSVTDFAPALDATANYVEQLSPRISPDGRFVAALQTTSYTDGASRQSIIVSDADGLNAQTLVEFSPDTNAFLSAPEWTPDGDVVYGTQDGSIMLVSMDGSGPRTAASVGTDIGSHVFYAPDRSRIAAMAARAYAQTSYGGSLPVWGLLLMDQDGANVQVLDVGNRELAPSGSLEWAGADVLLFTAERPRSVLMAVQKDGTGLAEVAALGDFGDFDWHP